MYQVTNNGRSARVFHHYGGTARVHPGETATADLDHLAAERLAEDAALDVRHIDDGEHDAAVAAPALNEAPSASETPPERAARLLRLESAREIEYVEFFSQARKLLGPESVFRGKTPRKSDILAALESVAHQGE